LQEHLPEAVILGRGAGRLPNTVMLALPGLDGETLLMGLDGQGFAVSSGAACGSAKNEPSHVLAAMGVSEELAQCSLRVSLGRGNSEAEVDGFVAALKNQAQALGRMAAATAWA
ncbi:MAG TPA: aminotransferase class V-fold PLP-dependent enzyme, partial [Gammaproteobacteria bacterium]|nr:aminotransferase class V-fold PLP-dependent enzyme [Gammaproteobacteria bacterium]